MDTEKLRVLVSAVESGSLTAAAEHLGYTPSGVSRIIAALEEEAGFPLLRRSRRGVEPSAECRRLLPHARRLIAAGEQYRQEALSIRGLERGALSVGSSYGSFYPALAALTADFCRRRPGIRVDIVQGPSTALAQAVEEGRLDLGVISRREGRFDWLPLRRDPLVAVLPPEHPLAALDALPLEVLGREPFIQILPGVETDNARLLRRYHIQPQVRCSSADYAAALSLVEAGLGLSLVNAILLEGQDARLAVLPLDPPQTVELGIALPSLEGCSPAARDYIAFARARLGRAG